MDIYIKTSLYNIISLNSRTGEMVTNTEVILQWKDKFLKWSPEAFNGTKVLRVPFDLVWIPDVILGNINSRDYDSSILRTNVIIDYAGNVKLMMHATYPSHCQIDIQWFPFDEQSCELEFMSWTSDVTQIRLHGMQPELSRYTLNQEYFLEDFYVTEMDDFDPCCDKPFSYVSYHIQVQRRVKFAMYFFIFPGILINICALFVFALPVECEEKVSLGINAILAMIVFLMEMIARIPPTERIPLAGVYYGSCLVVITLNIFFTVIVLNISFTGLRGIEVKESYRPILLRMASWLRVTVPPKILQKWAPVEKLFIARNNRPNATKVRDFDKVWTKFMGFEGNGNKNDSKTVNSTSRILPEEKTKQIENFQKRSEGVFESIQNFIENEKMWKEAETNYEMCVKEWKFAGRLFDRLTLIIFTFGGIIFNVYILTSGPHKLSFEFCPLGKDMCDGWSEEERMDGAGHGDSPF